MNTETRIFYHLFFGMRFNAPKFLKGNKGWNVAIQIGEVVNPNYH
jgi:hypothetical protein